MHKTRSGLKKQIPNQLVNKEKPLFEKITFQKGEIITITPDMVIGDVVLSYPEILPLLQKIGIHCVGCYASTFESIQEGVSKHGLNPVSVCKKINQIITKTHVRRHTTHPENG